MGTEPTVRERETPRAMAALRPRMRSCSGSPLALALLLKKKGGVVTFLVAFAVLMIGLLAFQSNPRILARGISVPLPLFMAVGVGGVRHRRSARAPRATRTSHDRAIVQVSLCTFCAGPASARWS